MGAKLATSLTVTNHVDEKGRALLALIQNYIKFSGFYYGFKPIGDSPEIRFPAVFVEPKGETTVMAGIGKYDIRIQFGIYWYVRGNTIEDVVETAGWIGAALKKLLSNNALGVIGTENPPRYRFKAYEGHWLSSEIIETRYAVTYLDAAACGVKYERAGRMMFEVQDVILL